MKTIAVIGSGQMGNGIAHVFAQSGYHVSLIDVREEALTKAMETIARNMDRQVAKGSLSEDDKAASLSRLSTTTDLAKGVASADLVVEAATERLDLKLKIF
ncbi:MAG: 3-hydroxyacyl-CoA dehydrogenase NAD-binding domain-containing protein, partial [Bacteroidota bacterium]